MVARKAIFLHLLLVFAVVFYVKSIAKGEVILPKYVLGADFGTESVRVAVFDRENGNIIDSAAVPYATTFPASGFAEQSPDEWWRNFCFACQNIFQNGKCKVEEIAALSVDTTACSVVALDEHFEYVAQIFHNIFLIVEISLIS